MRIQKIADKSDDLVKKQLGKSRKHKTPDVAGRLAGVGAGHVGTENWNEKMGLYQKMKEFGKVHTKLNKMLYQETQKKKLQGNTSSDDQLKLLAQLQHGRNTVSRKPITWRNKSDTRNQLTHGIKLGKAPQKLGALEATYVLNYGERHGRNILDENYKKEEARIRMFNHNR